MTLRKPRRLRPGDTIGVASLSGPADPERLERGCAFLSGLGYEVKRARNLGSRDDLLGLAGSDAERLAAYRELLHDPAVAAILFARGGYGIGRVLPLLDPAEIPPKIHCGFSDVTALSAFLLTRCSIPSFHGPMVAAELAGELDPVMASFFPAMLEGTGPREIDLRTADVLVPGHARGRLVGGCLSMLAALSGTPDAFDYDDAILFFEDIAEEAYRIDRMLGTLARAGRFAKLRAILIGTLTRVTFAGVENSSRLGALLEDRFAGLGVPVVSGFPCGHRGSNATLPVGALAELDTLDGCLRFLEEIVE